MSDPLYDNIFAFKLQAKQMQREAEKAQARQKNNTEMVKKAIAKSDMFSAKQYGNEVIRAKKDVQKYRTLSFKINAVASKLNAAYKNHQLTGQMQGLVGKMAHMNFNTVGAMETLENFEKLFDNLDVQGKTMDNVLDNIGVGTVNDQEVEDLINQCSEKQANNIDMMMNGPLHGGLNSNTIQNKQVNNPYANFFP